ncbi:MAG: chitobiase/beta-hexosaminidase C-terminal domain-containing protein [Deltaproteobacteria bacterium]|nr:chitobiase/beta-hexosaminidase C-terminal domain-containing protein [Deltaproteobacteria bacterium]
MPRRAHTVCRVDRLALVAGVLTSLLSSSVAVALDEEYEVSKDEPHTAYTRRWNWCQERDSYKSTTIHAESANRLDTSRSPDADEYRYMGKASASFTGLLPGKYEVWVFWRESGNRSSFVPWQVTSDGQGHTSASGHVNQYDANGQLPGEWHPLVRTQNQPLDVLGSLTLVFSVDKQGTGFDNRSVAYGGAKIIRRALSTVSTPTITPGGGAFDSAVTVVLATTTPSAEIRYTLDGSDPVALGTVYTAPLELTASSTVRARAFATEMIDSDEASAVFTIEPARDAGVPDSRPDGGVPDPRLDAGGDGRGDGPAGPPQIGAACGGCAAGPRSTAAVVLLTPIAVGWVLRRKRRALTGSRRS